MYWINGKIHLVWEITAACLGIVVGVIVAQWWILPDVGLVPIAVIFLVLFFIGQRIGRRWSLIFALLAGLALGLWRGGVIQSELAVFEPMIGHHVQLSGKVLDDPETNRRGELVLRVGELKSSGRSLNGEVWVTVKTYIRVQRSDQVVLDGKLSMGFGSRVASMRQATILSIKRETPGDIALVARNNFAAHVESSVNSPALDLGLGYLLGQKRGLSGDLAEALKVAGLTHIVVASGYNLTILVRMMRRLFAKISKFLAAFMSILLVVAFVGVTGLSPSMTRAGIVSILAIIAWYYGRRFHPVLLLSVAAAASLLINPAYGWGDLGWQLSFAAFAGVMILAPLASAYFFGNDKPRLVTQILFETLSAQIVTLPIILVAFGQLSNVAPLANLLIVPFVPLAMLLTFTTGAAAYFSKFLADILGSLTQLLLDAMIFVIHWCANLNWAQSEWPLPVWGAVVWYTLLVALIVWLWRTTGYRLHRSSIVD